MKAITFIWWIILFNSVMSLLFALIPIWLPEGAENLISLPINNDLTIAVNDFTNNVTAIFSNGFDVGALLNSFVSLFQMLFNLFGCVVGFFPALIVWLGAPEIVGVLLQTALIFVLFYAVFQLITNRSLLYNE